MSKSTNVSPAENRMDFTAGGGGSWANDDERELCAGCGRLIAGGKVVIRAETGPFHERCWAEHLGGEWDGR